MKPAAIKKLVLVMACFAAVSAYAVSASSRADEAISYAFRQAAPAREGFPHEIKKHREIPCSKCHLGGKEKPDSTDQPMAKHFPHTSCVGCHNFAAEFFRGAMGGGSRFCTICHEQRRISNADKALRAGVIKSPASDFNDAFSHDAHRKPVPGFVRIAPIGSGYGNQFRTGEVSSCMDCHEPLRKVALDAKDMRTQKGHAACFVCHGGLPGERAVAAEKFPYSNDCGTCHELKETGRETGLRPLFGSIRGFRHLDHEIDISPKKKGEFPLSTVPDRLCVECHKPVDELKRLGDIRLPKVGYCDRCHIDKKPGLPARLSDEIRSKLETD